VIAGDVLLLPDRRRADKPGLMVADDVELEVRPTHDFVSRGGVKLANALDAFGLDVTGARALDVGASTGGFTDCLLQNGARLVYAVDVGYGQLAWSIRNDPRVITMERTNIRLATADMFEEKPELAVIDVSFISLALVLPVVREILTEDGQAICLIKPQFEAGRENVGKKGVVRDPKTHEAVLEAFTNSAEGSGFYVKDYTYSPIVGPEGNIEFLGWLGSSRDKAGVLRGASEVVAEAHRELSQGSGVRDQGSGDVG